MAASIDEEEDAPKPPKKAGPLAILGKLTDLLKDRKIVLIGGGVAALLLLLGGGAYAFLGIGKPAASGEAIKPVQKPAYFLALPDITVNLNTVDKRAAFMKLSISLELADKTVEGEIQPYMPRILDAFQVYLRELRPSDLEGSAGMFRLKEELERRINIAVYPAKIDGVLFKQILVQ